MLFLCFQQIDISLFLSQHLTVIGGDTSHYIMLDKTKTVLFLQLCNLIVANFSSHL